MTILSHVEDPRAPLEKFRRTQLWRIAKAAGIPYPNGAPATTMRALIADAGVNVSKYMDIIQGGALHQRNDSEIKAPKDDFEAMPMPQLRKLAKERGIKFEPTDKKVDLIEKLNG